MDYPEYELEEKKVEILEKGYDAFFPKEHTNVQGVVLDCHDLNAWDFYANITRYHLNLLILKKGESKWSIIHSGLKSDYKGDLDINGLYPLLFSLEEDSFKRNFLKNEEIKSLEKNINNSQKRLNELLD